jgi:hypothetical protein
MLCATKTARAHGGNKQQLAHGQAAVSAAQSGFEGGPHISSFSNVSNAGTLITIFPSCFQIHICECFKISNNNNNNNNNRVRCSFRNIRCL